MIQSPVVLAVLTDADGHCVAEYPIPGWEPYLILADPSELTTPARGELVEVQVRWFVFDPVESELRQMVEGIDCVAVYRLTTPSASDT